MEPIPEFDRDAAERVLRRAIELSEEPEGADGVSGRALLEAAEELGVDGSVVLRAMGEEQLGLLTPGGSPADRLVGPAALTASRVVPGSPAEALERVDAWLRRMGGLRRQRVGPPTAVYTRRTDVAAGLQRVVRSLSGEEDLRRISRLRVEVRPLDEDESLVAIVADLRSERAWALAGGTGIAGVGTTVSLVQALTWSPWLWLGVPASVAAGVGVMAARTSGLDDLDAALASVLDRVAAGEEPVGLLGDVRRRLLDAAVRGRNRQGSEGRRVASPE